MRKCFTLLELLVVVAIIGILASILLPSLSGAKRKAEQAVCGSNMKQVTVAISLFLNNNKQFFPIGIRNNWPYDDFISQYDGRDLSQADIDAKRFDNTAENREPHRLYRCPSSKSWESATYVQRSYGLNNGHGSWYKPNSSGLTWLRWKWEDNYNKPISIGEINNPSQMYLLTENDITSTTANSGAIGHTNSSQGRYKYVTDNQSWLNLHGATTINATFVDGSMRVQRLGDLSQLEHWDRTE